MKIDLKKWLVRGAIGVAALVLVVVVAFFGWREYAQSSVIADRAITTGKGVELLEKVRIGGIDQWINVRGQNRDNPVLLHVHGGPGDPMMPFSHIFQTPWEKYFTVVQWDQRSAGKTYTGNDPEAIRPTLTIDRMVEDARELTEYLRNRFGKDKILVLCHSWGTMMGIPLVKRYPELFYAYVGVGQVVNVHENEIVGYRQTLKVARERNISQAVSELEALAPYPHPTEGTKKTRHLLREWQREFGYELHNISRDELLRKTLLAGLASPEYNLAELKDLFLFKGNTLARTQMEAEIDAFDLNPLGYDFELPLVFLLGRHDWITPSVIAEAYLGKVNAPHKKLVWFEDSAHGVPGEEPEKFFRALVEEVLPLASR